MKREHLGSRIGFILLSAGCAIGIGNVWKFPYMTGIYGGAAFVLVYIIFLAILGIPVMTMEFAMGRASQKSPVKMYDELTDKPAKWKWHSYAAFAANIVLMMFYAPVCGWFLRYFVDMTTGKFVGLDSNGIVLAYDNLMMQPGSMVVYTLITVICGTIVCSIGLQKGLERVTKVMMTALLVIMIVLAINSIALGGDGVEGLKFYLLPDFKRMAEIGVGEVLVGAMNQSFFTLSLGIGSMAIFGSYLGKERSLLGESVNVAILDTFVALSSGLIIFPACFAYGVEVDSGPSLIFLTLPNIFNNMPLGRLWGSLFFLFLTFAAFSTVLAVFENIMAMIMDLFGWSRKKTGLIFGVAMAFLTLPCILGSNVWKDFTPFGKSIMDLEDFFVSNLMLPIGSLTIVLFCVTRYGWGWKKFMAEANEGTGLKVAKWMRPYMTYVLPLVILTMFLIGVL